MIAGGEKGLNLSVKDDLLALLSGEITVELDKMSPDPEWKAILKVNDAAHLQKTLTTLLLIGHLPTETAESDGVSYYTIHIPSQKPTHPIGYAFVDGYLLVASSPQALRETIRLHAAGESLAKSKKFLNTLPPGRSPDASALFYQDPIAFAGLQWKQSFPDLAETLAQFLKDAAPLRHSRLRRGIIPNSRIQQQRHSRCRPATNRRSHRHSQSRSFAHSPPQRGQRRRQPPQREYCAGLLRENVSPAGLCSQFGCFRLRFPMLPALIRPSTQACSTNLSPMRVAPATRGAPNLDIISESQPSARSGRARNMSPSRLPSTPTPERSFCSTSDGVIRFKSGPPLTSSLSVSECREWQPLH